MRLVLKSLLVLLSLGLVSSCVSKKKYDDLMASKQQSDAALADTQKRVKSLEQDNATLKSDMEAEKTRLNGELSGLRKDLDATRGQMNMVQEKLNMTQAELTKIKDEINGIFTTYEKSGLKLEEKNGGLYVITAPISYRSGSYSLTRAEKEALAELAMTLKNNPAVKIQIEGHTDNVKVNSGASYQDNWELSARRALAVVRELVKKGASPAQVSVAGRADTMPKGDNSTRDGKAQNRRTEVKVDASMKALLDAAKKN
ncbi:MAG: flagellar motor protein MotB [Haliscomenobacter sp.]